MKMMGSKASSSGRAERAKRAKAGSSTKRRVALQTVRNASANKRALTNFVKHVVDTRREYKFFKTVGDANLANKPPKISTAPGMPAASQVKVASIGYSTTVNVIPGNTLQVYYPGATAADGTLARTNPVLSMTMADTFATTETSADGATRAWFRAQAPDGVKVTPIFARSKFVIERKPVNFNEQGVVENASTTPGFGPDAIHLLPIMCRVVRVHEKTAPGVALINNPASDLFLTQYGQEYGVDFVAFGKNDCRFSKINRRRYTVLNDYQFELDQTNIVNHTSPGAFSSSTTTRSVGARGSGKSYKVIDFDHQLTIKKGGDLTFNNPDATGTNNFTTGGRREYVFFHFWYAGSLADVAAAAGFSSPAEEILISCTPSSAFRD